MRKVALALLALLLATPALAQDVINPQTDASKLTTGALPAARMPALTGDCTTSAGAVATTCTKTSGVAFGGYATISAGVLTNTLGGNVTLTPQSTYSTTGPSVAQGATGTWFASGTITLTDSAATSSVACKLWDGTTVFASGRANILAAGAYTTISVSGFKTSPAGNIRIDCVGLTTATSSMANNGSGQGVDSTVTVFRIN